MGLLIYDAPDEELERTKNYYRTFMSEDKYEPIAYNYICASKKGFYTKNDSEDIKFHESYDASMINSNGEEIIRPEIISYKGNQMFALCIYNLHDMAILKRDFPTLNYFPETFILEDFNKTWWLESPKEHN